MPATNNEETPTVATALGIPLLVLVIALAVSLGLMIAFGIASCIVHNCPWRCHRAQPDVEKAHRAGRVIYDADHFELAHPLTPTTSNGTTIFGDSPKSVEGSPDPILAAVINMPSAAAIARYHKARSGTRAATHQVFDRRSA